MNNLKIRQELKDSPELVNAKFIGDCDMRLSEKIFKCATNVNRNLNVVRLSNSLNKEIHFWFDQNVSRAFTKIAQNSILRKTCRKYDLREKTIRNIIGL